MSFLEGLEKILCKQVLCPSVASIGYSYKYKIDSLTKTDDRKTNGLEHVYTSKL